MAGTKKEEYVKMDTPEIKLDQFLKWCGAVDSGARAKLMLREGDVQVNGEVEMKRGRKLHAGDVVAVAGGPVFRLVGE